MKAMHRPDEVDMEAPVIEAVLAGDRFAFEELVRRHDRWVRSVVFGALADRSALDDVVQQVWTTAWRRIGELRDPTRWKPWLYRLARNAAYDAGRELKRRRQLAQAGTGSAGGTASFDAGSIDEEQRRLVLSAIEALPAIYREPFVLRHVNGWSYQRIGDVMGLPVDTVETRLVRARRLLREALEGKVNQS